MASRHTATLERLKAPMVVQSLPISDVIPYDNNPRRNDGAIAKVARSLQEFGWKQPIVVDRKMVVVVGHTRLLAARLLGAREVPVVIARDLTPTQCKAYRLTDNRTGDEAEWNDDLLRVEIGDLRDLGFDLGTTGFDAGELGKLRLDEAALEGKQRKLADNLQFQVVVDCASETDQAELITRLKAERRVCRPLTL